MERFIIDRIRQRILLLKGNKSVKEFAEYLGLPLSTVYYYLNGREPSLSFLLRIAERFNVREEWLLTGKEPIFKEDRGEPFMIEDVIEFLKKHWESWSLKKRHCFETHFKQLFPEFEIWLNERLMD